MVTWQATRQWALKVIIFKVLGVLMDGPKFYALLTAQKIRNEQLIFCFSRKYLRFFLIIELDKTGDFIEPPV